MKVETRRQFLAGAAGAAAMLALGGAGAAFASDGELLRPPGGQDEARLRALCVKCDRCRSVCPRICVEPASVADGLLEARIPKLNFHRGYCDFCGKCIDACPTGALEAFDEEVDKIGLAVIDTEKCLAYVRGTCTVCEGSCDYEALAFDERGLPHIDEDKCNGCGACVMACNVNVNGTYGGGLVRAVEVWTERQVRDGR